MHRDFCQRDQPTEAAPPIALQWADQFQHQLAAIALTLYGAQELLKATPLQSAVLTLRERAKMLFPAFTLLSMENEDRLLLDLGSDIRVLPQESGAPNAPSGVNLLDTQVLVQIGYRLYSFDRRSRPATLWRTSLVDVALIADSLPNSCLYSQLRQLQEDMWIEDEEENEVENALVL